jgi:hypothetical protein
LRPGGPPLNVIIKRQPLARPSPLYVSPDLHATRNVLERRLQPGVGPMNPPVKRAANKASA